MSFIQIVIFIGVIIYYVVKAVNTNKEKQRKPRPKPLTSRPAGKTEAEKSLEDIFREFMEEETSAPASPPARPQHSSPVSMQAPEPMRMPEPMQAPSMKQIPLTDYHSSSGKFDAADKEAHEALKAIRARERKEMDELIAISEAEHMDDYAESTASLSEDLKNFNLRQAIIANVVLERKYF